MQAFRAPLAALIGEACDKSDIIAGAELLAMAALALYAGGQKLWQGSAVLCAGDNSDVHRWLEPQGRLRYAAFSMTLIDALDGDL